MARLSKLLLMAHAGTVSSSLLRRAPRSDSERVPLPIERSTFFCLLFLVEEMWKISSPLTPKPNVHVVLIGHLKETCKYERVRAMSLGEQSKLHPKLQLHWRQEQENELRIQSSARIIGGPSIDIIQSFSSLQGEGIRLVYGTDGRPAKFVPLVRWCLCLIKLFYIWFLFLSFSSYVILLFLTSAMDRYLTLPKKIFFLWNI